MEEKNQEKTAFAYKNDEPNKESTLEKMHEVIAKEAKSPSEDNNEKIEKENYK